MTVPRADYQRLRDLAKRVAEISSDPAMGKRRKMWVEHNSLRSGYPMILLFPEGSWREILPESSFKLTDEFSRSMEGQLLRKIYTYEHFQDDSVVDNEWPVEKFYRVSGLGLEPKRIASPEANGAWHFDPVLKGPEDLKKLTYPEVTVDEKRSASLTDEATEIFGAILNVKQVGVKHISYHLMKQYSGLRGLEETMLDMYAEPQMLHDAMAFLETAHKRVLKQFVDMNLLSLNNDNTYHNSGGNSFTDQLPAPGFNPDRVRPCDMWASAEAQEMAQVSPEHHEEFILQYEKRLLEPFGLTGYGCCEDLTRKMDRVLKIPHMRRISISPWADVDVCAEQLKDRKAIFSWKPHPAHLVGEFNAAAVRAYIRHTVEVCQANGCVLEMILKDTHTCQNHPERFDMWTRIAREVITEMAGPYPV